MFWDFTKNDEEDPAKLWPVHQMGATEQPQVATPEPTAIVEAPAAPSVTVEPSPIAAPVPPAPENKILQFPTKLEPQTAAPQPTEPSIPASVVTEAPNISPFPSQQEAAPVSQDTNRETEPLSPVETVLLSGIKFLGVQNDAYDHRLGAVIGSEKNGSLAFAFDLPRDGYDENGNPNTSYPILARKGYMEISGPKEVVGENITKLFADKRHSGSEEDDDPTVGYQKDGSIVIKSETVSFTFKNDPKEKVSIKPEDPQVVIDELKAKKEAIDDERQQKKAAEEQANIQSIDSLKQIFEQAESQNSPVDLPKAA